MAQRKSFLLRLDPEIHEALQRWADAEMRSLNAQIEFLLRASLRQASRLRPAAGSPTGGNDSGGTPNVEE